MGNQCCAFKGKKNKAGGEISLIRDHNTTYECLSEHSEWLKWNLLIWITDAYSRTSIEHQSIEKMAEDRVKKTTSSSASERRVSKCIISGARDKLNTVFP